ELGGLDERSHVRLAHPDANDGNRILRRGFNYVGGNNSLGRLDAGLFFISYQRDPQQFISLQRKLSVDLMNEYIRHVGSGIWAVPPGAQTASYIGAPLFAGTGAAPVRLSCAGIRSGRCGDRRRTPAPRRRTSSAGGAR